MSVKMVVECLVSAMIFFTIDVGIELMSANECKIINVVFEPRHRHSSVQSPLPFRQTSI